MTATEPRVSSREEAITHLGASFKRTMAAVRKLKGRDTHRPGSPSLAACQLLFVLADRGELSSGELALAASLPRLGHPDARLARELELVARTRSTTDRRIVTCSLTDAGRQLVHGPPHHVRRALACRSRRHRDRGSGRGSAVLDRIG